jgi:4-oxalocrotonate tautomerase
LVGRTTNNCKEAALPLINVRLIEGVFDEDEKQQMIEKLTDAMVDIEGENMRGVTWVVIDEVKSGDWGMGGRSVSAGNVRSLRTGVPV